MDWGDVSGLGTSEGSIQPFSKVPRVGFIFVNVKAEQLQAGAG